MSKYENLTQNLPNTLVEQIEQISETQLDELILLVSRRYYQLRPEREGIFLTLPLDPQKRDEELKELVRLLRLPQNKA